MCISTQFTPGFIEDMTALCASRTACEKMIIGYSLKNENAIRQSTQIIGPHIFVWDVFGTAVSPPPNTRTKKKPHRETERGEN